MKDIVSQSSYFKSRKVLVTLGELEEETSNFGKRLEWRDRDETWTMKVGKRIRVHTRLN